MSMLAPTAEAARPLLALREDIAIFPGPVALDGSPTWTLHDPPKNRFYRLGWREFEILSRWQGGTAEFIVDQVTEETTLRVDAQDVEEMKRFLFAYDLLHATSPQSTQHLVEKAARQRQSVGHWVLHNYLFTRIPLLRPDSFLTATEPYVRWASSRAFTLTIITLGLIGLYGVARQWDLFLSTFIDMFSLEGAVWFGVTLAGLKVIHELGHAYTAKRFGCRVPTMGIALLVMIPVLYTDVNESWKLNQRRERMVIGLAGVTLELCCAAVALFAWTLLPNGPARSAMFMIATSTWVTTVLINLSPFMRYDGYFVLSDWLEIPNLHSRAFALAQWWIRKTLLGLDDLPPEDLPAGRRNLLIVFAIGTWIYRLALFLGIAALVYHFVIKLLGVAMALVEVGYFIVRPIANEFRVWWKRWADLRWSFRTALTFAGLVVAVLLFLVPWRSAIEAPALLKSEQHVQVFVPEFGSRLVDIAVTDGQRVEKGQSLLQLVSPDLNYRLSRIRNDLALYEWQMSVRSADAEQLARSLVTEREYEASLAEYRGLNEQQTRLQVAAPVSGKIVDISPGLQRQAWLPPKFRLLSIVDPLATMVEAYVEEADLARIASGNTAVFFAEADSRIEVPLRVIEISRASTRLLPDPYLSSLHGGPINVRAQKQNELVPDRTIYRVRLAPLDATFTLDKVLRGRVILDGEPVSLAKRAWRAMLAIGIRESGA